MSYITFMFEEDWDETKSIEPKTEAEIRQAECLALDEAYTLDEAYALDEAYILNKAYTLNEAHTLNEVYTIDEAYPLDKAYKGLACPTPGFERQTL